MYKKIPSLENPYYINEHGEIYRERKTVCVKLRPFTHPKNGYMQIALTNNRVLKTHRIHRLVAETFLGESDLFVNHIDGNKTNNHVSNLEYCTKSENVKHAYKLGLLKSKKGSENKRSKLTEDIIIRIKELHKHKIYTKSLLAERFDVSISCIKGILSNRNWKHAI